MERPAERPPSPVGAPIAASALLAPGTAAGSTPGTLQLEYLASAARADVVRIDLFGSAGSWRARIAREDGTELVRAARDLSRSYEAEAVPTPGRQRAHRPQAGESTTDDHDPLGFCHIRKT